MSSNKNTEHQCQQHLPLLWQPHLCLWHLSYDYLVQRRNKELTQQAVRSDKLVSSLFPGDIKDRILEQQDVSTCGSQRTSFLVDSKQKNTSSIMDNQQFSPLAKVPPFYLETGFTQWSATRPPVEVFELLETLYTAFDAIAHRRRVYKVETLRLLPGLILNQLIFADTVNPDFLSTSPYRLGTATLQQQVFQLHSVTMLSSW